MDELRKIIVDLNRRLELMEKGLVVKIITIPPNDTGALVPKVVSSDPASPKNNEVWINSTSSQLKWNNAGTIKAVSLV